MVSYTDLDRMTISIILTTYNRASLLVRAIHSVLAQTCLSFELIVVDDGSTDNTKELVGQFDGAMNPLDVTEKVAHIPQRHFVGLRDKVVPSVIAESFVKIEGNKDYKRITVVDGATHNDGWLKRWKELLLMSLIAE